MHASTHIAILCLLASIISYLASAQLGPQNNNFGVAFQYKLAWVNVQTSKFGVELTPNYAPNSPQPTAWSLSMTFPQSARTTLETAGSDVNRWDLQTRDGQVWVASPMDTMPNNLYMTGTTTGQMDLEDTIKELAIPQQLVLYPRNMIGDTSVAYVLKLGTDYTVDEGINLAQIPTEPFGPWIPQPKESIVIPSAVAASASESDASTTSLSSSQSESSASEFSDETGVSSADSPDKNEVGKQSDSNAVKFIKGDPDYDKSVNPLARQFAAPLTGLYLFCTVAGIGILSYIVGTAIRLRYKYSYQQLLKKMTANYPPELKSMAMP
ncbi:hypothetical protein H4219_000615 [Mycoemilia scoparia]|uniref:Uncharacterized protein n=1 Tax=Mycoemilia scoparia TaxID=417184 RepID=A0A9W8DX69_9FUNG|nr:hypothetical protein H4219_000615 [Mycoemilia scoparia]